MARPRTAGIASTVLVALVATSGCELFGLGDIHCRTDEFCPTGYRCSASVCVPTSDLFGNPIDAGVAFDGAWPHDPVVITCPVPPCCQVAPCSLMPDSATPYCRTREWGHDPCPTDPNADFFGQDSNYDTGTPSYDIPENGTVIDRVSGLVWEQYPTSVREGRLLKWREAATYCSTLPLDGRSWRLPKLRELVTLVDYGVESLPMLDLIAFPQTSSAFWSASGGSGFNVWLEFDNGTTGFYSDYTAAAVRCVSGEPQTAGDFGFISGEGDFLDRRSGLVWSCEQHIDVDWKDALGACEDSSRNSHEDWRLPSIKELVTLVDLSRDPVVQSLCPPNGRFALWSSTPCIHSSGAWWLSDTGFTGCSETWATMSATFCVRTDR